MPAPFVHTLGPHNAKLVLVGEAFGETEELVGLPFQGASGQELTKMLREAGINRSECLLTNVLALRPPGNNVEKLCGKKAEVGGKDYPLPPLRNPGIYLRPEYFPELARLDDELNAYPRNLVVALGNTATWALLGRGAISAIRGTVATATHAGKGIKCIPTFHPASVLRNWSQRTIVIQDLTKALRESAFPEVRRPERQVTINPSREDIVEWFGRPAQIYAVDIETQSRQISMIGFARSRSDALVIPFFNKAGENFWESPSDEVWAWQKIKEVLEDPRTVKLWQNGLYDIQYLYKMGIRPANSTQDTMLLHHALYPELQKGLGFLGSIYTQESAWKLMRSSEGNKRDE